MNNVMKILSILLLLILQQSTIDTAKRKDVATFKKIDHQVAQIKAQERTKKHSTDDIYSLQLKSFNTLTQSHALSKEILIKNDSLEAIVKNNNQKMILMNQKQDQLQAMVSEYAGYKDRFNQFNEKLERLTLLFSIGCVVLYLLRVGMREHVKRVRQQHNLHHP